MSKIICWKCGKAATKSMPHWYYDERLHQIIEYQVQDLTKHYRCYCDDCIEKVKAADKEDVANYIRLKKLMMFNRALNLLEKQRINMYKYKDAIDVVEEHIKNNPDKYDSSYEVIAAIMLVHNRVLSKMQYKIGKYQVDFLLPEMGVVLEIDGDRHRYKKDYDSKRDAEIKKILGYGWDIVRIKTEYIEQNATKIVKAIEMVIEYRETNHIPWRKLST